MRPFDGQLLSFNGRRGRGMSLNQIHPLPPLPGDANDAGWVIDGEMGSVRDGAGNTAGPHRQLDDLEAARLESPGVDAAVHTAMQDDATSSPFSSPDERRSPAHGDMYFDGGAPPNEETAMNRVEQLKVADSWAHHARPEGPDAGGQERAPVLEQFAPAAAHGGVPVTEMTARRAQPQAGGGGVDAAEEQQHAAQLGPHEGPPHGAHTPPPPEESEAGAAGVRGGIPVHRDAAAMPADYDGFDDDAPGHGPDTNQGGPPQTPAEANGLVEPERARINWPSRKIERDSKLLKQAVEAVVAKRVARRRTSSREFAMSTASLLMYLAFLGMLTTCLLQAPAADLAVHKQAVEASLSSSRTFALSSVTSIDDVYRYISTVLSPAAYPPPPNSTSGAGLLANGVNSLLGPIAVRQLRVRADGGAYPAFSLHTQESRNGGGTWLSADPGGVRPDWPVRAEWAEYRGCVVGTKNACFVDDGRAIRRGTYAPGGYYVLLPGSVQLVEAKLAEMRAGGFADVDGTRAVFVEGVASLVYRRFLCTATMLFEVVEGGHVLPSVKVRVADLEFSTSPTWFIYTTIVCALAAALSLTEVFSLVLGSRPYMTSGWTYLSWSNYAAIFVWYWLRTANAHLEVEAQAALKTGSVGTSDIPFHEVLWRHELAHTTLALSAILSYLRLLGFLEPLSPATRRIVGILRHASRPLGVSILFLATIVAGGSLALISCLGRSHIGFSTPSSSLASLLFLSSGSLDASPFVSEFPQQLPPILAILVLAAIVFLCLLTASAAQGATGEEHEWSTEGSQIVTLDRVIESTARQLSTMVKAKKVKDIKDDIEKRRAAWEELGDAMGGEYLTRLELAVLFSRDKEALKRMNVHSVDELVRLVCVTGEERLPMREVHNFRNSLQESLRERELLEEEVIRAAKPDLDATLVQTVVDGCLKRAVGESETKILEAIDRVEKASASRFRPGGMGGRKGLRDLQRA